MLEVPDGSGARPWADISNREKLEARLVRYGEKEIGAERFIDIRHVRES